MPTFRVKQPKVVVHTRLTGFTKRTFTRGIRHAYRKAYAFRYSIADVKRIIISNIHDKTEKTGTRRRLASAGIEFDVQVSAGTSAGADALKAQIKGSEDVAVTVLLDQFKKEIALVAASSEYDDVTTQTTVPTMSLVTEAAITALETGAPTPAPTPIPPTPAPTPNPPTPAPVAPSGGDGPPIPAIAGACAAVGVAISAVLWRRKQTAEGTATSSTSGAARKHVVADSTSDVTLSGADATTHAAEQQVL